MQETRLRGLDGLRALCVIGVILFHSREYAGIREHFILYIPASRGAYGVHAFFVLSGFLITRLLLKEEAISERINLKSFFVRRALRILPAALFYLLILGAFYKAGYVAMSTGEFARSVLFLRNYQPTGSGSVFTAHFWSLAVEEQFYLLWPLCLTILPRAYRCIGVISAIALTILSQIVMMYSIGPANVNRLGFNFSVDILLIGCLLAVCHQKYRSFATGTWLPPMMKLIATLALIGVMLSPIARTGSAIITPISQLAGSIGIAIFIDLLKTGGSSVMDKMFNWSPFAWLGRMSYSVYLWQQPFINSNMPLGRANEFPQCIIFALACAAISYYCVEIPVLMSRRQIAARSTAPVPRR